MISEVGKWQKVRRSEVLVDALAELNSDERALIGARNHRLSHRGGHNESKIGDSRRISSPGLVILGLYKSLLCSWLR